MNTNTYNVLMAQEQQILQMRQKQQQKQQKIQQQQEQQIWENQLFTPRSSMFSEGQCQATKVDQTQSSIDSILSSQILSSDLMGVGQGIGGWNGSDIGMNFDPTPIGGTTGTFGDTWQHKQLQQQQQQQQQQQFQSKRQKLQQSYEQGQLSQQNLSSDQLNSLLCNPELLQQLLNSSDCGTNNLQDLFNPKCVSQDTHQRSTVPSNKDNLLFLETKVAPVKRAEPHAEPSLFPCEDDLWKMFGMGDDSHMNSNSTVGANPIGATSANNDTVVPPMSSSDNMSTRKRKLHADATPESSSFPAIDPDLMSSSEALTSKQQQEQPTERPTTPKSASSPVDRSPAQSPLSAPSSVPVADTAFLLPSTMVPPTVLASVLPDNKSRSSSTAKNKSKKVNKSQRTESPQDVLMRILDSRGYKSAQRIRCEDAGYDTTPSPLQLASFGTEVVKAFHTSDVKLLDSLLSCGLSPNPCNQFRDSIVDLVCKRGNADIFQCLLKNGCDVRVCDGFGRTLLHHCAWASTFPPEIAHAILKRDPLQILIEDKRGQVPLDYVRAELADDWIDFLESNKDEYWPEGNMPPELQRPKDKRPDGVLPDPENAISVTLASMVSSGQISPDEVAKMDEETKKKVNQSETFETFG